MFNKREITEFEWYMRDHLFRQSNQGREKFQKDQLGIEMSKLYLRYRTSNLEKLNELTEIIIENLVSHQVLQRVEMNRSLQITSRLSRLKCSNCYYISYLSRNEPRNCLRCSSSELNDFPQRRHPENWHERSKADKGKNIKWLFFREIIFGIIQAECVNVFERLSVEVGEIHIVQISFAILMEHMLGTPFVIFGVAKQMMS